MPTKSAQNPFNSKITEQKIKDENYVTLRNHQCKKENNAIKEAWVILSNLKKTNAEANSNK